MSSERDSRKSKSASSTNTSNLCPVCEEPVLKTFATKDNQTTSVNLAVLSILIYFRHRTAPD